jgi:hypothetical protein
MVTNFNIQIKYIGLEDFVNDTTEKELIHNHYNVNHYEVIGIIAKWVLLSNVLEIKITKLE